MIIGISFLITIKKKMEPSSDCIIKGKNPSVQKLFQWKFSVIKNIIGFLFQILTSFHVKRINKLRIILAANSKSKYQILSLKIVTNISYILKVWKENKNLECGLNQKQRLLKNDTQGLLIGCVLQHQKNKSSCLSTGRPNIKKKCSF